MTVFCITVSAAFGEQESRISSASEACLRGSLAPVILERQSKAAEKQVFTFFCDAFMVRLLYQEEEKKKEKRKGSSLACFLLCVCRTRLGSFARDARAILLSTTPEAGWNAVTAAQKTKGWDLKYRDVL